MPNSAEKQALRREAAPLLTRLSHLKDRWPSEPALSCLSPRMVDALLEYIGNEESVRPFAGWTVTFVLTGGAVWVARGSLEVASVIMLLQLTWAYLMLYDPAAGQRCAVYALTQTDDIRLLPTLIRATRFPWGKHPHIIRAIYRLLDQVTEEHIGLLNGEVQQRLWRLPSGETDTMNDWNPLWALRKLEMFARIGDREILQRMQEMARSSSRNVSGRRIILAAQQLVPVMEARLERQQVPATLLRASDLPTSAPETLLRAAHAATPEPSAQLLRASTSETPADEM